MNKIVLQKKNAWYDRHTEKDGPLAVLREAGVMVGMAGFFLAMMGLGHAVAFYDRLRRR